MPWWLLPALPAAASGAAPSAAPPSLQLSSENLSANSYRVEHVVISPAAGAEAALTSEEKDAKDEVMPVLGFAGAAAEVAGAEPSSMVAEAEDDSEGVGEEGRLGICSCGLPITAARVGCLVMQEGRASPRALRVAS
jgi:hypothetical protein